MLCMKSGPDHHQTISGTKLCHGQLMCWIPGPRLNIKTVFPRYGIHMLKIRRSRDRLIFNMGIPILVRRHLYIETVPSIHALQLIQRQWFSLYSLPNMINCLRSQTDKIQANIPQWCTLAMYPKCSRFLWWLVAILFDNVTCSRILGSIKLTLRCLTIKSHDVSKPRGDVKKIIVSLWNWTGACW